NAICLLKSINIIKCIFPYANIIAGMPVATAKVFKSKIISSFGKPTTFVNSLCGHQMEEYKNYVV
ncbi:MAG: hypothetical protein ACTS47_02020, partial [Candidatus Hodgkinia cicadicola]